MRQAIGLLGGTLLALSGASGLESKARAQETYVRSSVPAPTKTVELQLSGGYTQGFGNIAPHHAIGDVAGAGAGITASLGYRYSPAISFEIESQYQGLTSEHFGTSQGVDTNVGVTLHAAPHRRADPWLRLATGYRWLWVSHANPGPFSAQTGTSDNVSFSGWDVLNARIGYDMRSSGGVAWAPVVGANLQTFAFVNSTSMSSLQWGTFIYAGLQGRFDAVGGDSHLASAHGGRSTE